MLAGTKQFRSPFRQVQAAPTTEPLSTEELLTHMARPRNEGNTFSVGFTGAGNSGEIHPDCQVFCR